MAIVSDISAGASAGGHQQGDISRGTSAGGHQSAERGEWFREVSAKGQIDAEGHGISARYKFISGGVSD
jgi:hypothetical protein